MSELYDEALRLLAETSNEAIAAVFGVMAAAPQHTFQVLTKRADRLPKWFEWAASSQFDPADLCLGHAAGHIHGVRWERALEKLDLGSIHTEPPEWPLPNVWIGVSVEDHARADERIPHLLRTPAAVRFLSCEPLLGAVNLRLPIPRSGEPKDARIDWVIVGGESGAGARPMAIEWARSIVDQCQRARVAVFVKQLGTRPSQTEDGGATLVQWKLKSKGGDMADFPPDLRVRQFPEARG